MIQSMLSRKTMAIILATFTVFFCVFVGTSIAEEYQPALWFMDDLKITQVPGGDYSHAGTLNFDVVGVNNRNIKAPFDGIIVERFPTYGGGNTVVIQSKNRVQYANGNVGYMSLAFGHDNDISDCYIGREVRQGEVFCQNGDFGNAQGVHSHVTVIAGKYTDDPGFKQVSTGRYTFANAITPEAALFVSETTNIVDTKGIKFKKYDAKKEIRIYAAGGSTTGAGKYKPGEKVQITATADEYHTFSSWTSSVDGIVENANSSTTNITVPQSDVTLTANFKLKMGSVIQNWENMTLRLMLGWCIRMR